MVTSCGAMEFRLIEYNKDLYIVLGQGYDSNFDPPEILIAVPLTDSLVRSCITNICPIVIPLNKAIEITDKNRLKAILVLYGG